MPKVQSFERETGGHSRRSRRTTSSLAEINVVPLVDVMLVLLIIFMVTAPMMQHGIGRQTANIAPRGGEHQRATSDRHRASVLSQGQASHAW